MQGKMHRNSAISPLLPKPPLLPPANSQPIAQQKRSMSATYPPFRSSPLLNIYMETPAGEA